MNDLTVEKLPLHLQPPKIFGDINIRITLRPNDEPKEGEPEKLLALGNTIDSSQLAVVNAKLKSGTIEISITNGFGRQRTMVVSPAELLFLLGQAQKFVEELPE